MGQKYEPWKLKDIRILSDTILNSSVDEGLALHPSRSIHTIRWRLYKHGYKEAGKLVDARIKSLKAKSFKPKEKASGRRAYEFYILEGLSWSDLANTCGFKTQYHAMRVVSNFAQRFGYPLRSNG